MWTAKEAESNRVKYWEIIADDLSIAGWSWAVSAINRLPPIFLHGALHL
jgi:hypothetical protein